MSWRGGGGGKDQKKSERRFSNRNKGFHICKAAQQKQIVSSKCVNGKLQWKFYKPMEIRLKWSCSERLVTSPVKCNECDIKLESRLSRKSITCSKIFEKYTKSIWKIHQKYLRNTAASKNQGERRPHHHPISQVQLYGAWLSLFFFSFTNFVCVFFSFNTSIFTPNVTASHKLQFKLIRFYNFYYM